MTMRVALHNCYPRRCKTTHSGNLHFAKQEMCINFVGFCNVWASPGWVCLGLRKWDRPVLDAAGNEKTNVI